MVTMEVENAKTSAVQFIRDLIVSGELEAGQKLVEKKLASILGISAIPLREAFRVLEAEYLVLNIPRKGVYVTELSIEDLQKAFQAREMIECYVIKILMEKNIRELPEVASVVNSTLPPFIPVHKSRMDKLQYYKTWANFHRKLLEASNNILLINLYSSISSLLHRYLCIYEYIPGDCRRS